MSALGKYFVIDLRSPTICFSLQLIARVIFYSTALTPLANDRARIQNNNSTAFSKQNSSNPHPYGHYHVYAIAYIRLRRKYTHGYTSTYTFSKQSRLWAASAAVEDVVSIAPPPPPPFHIFATRTAHSLQRTLAHSVHLLCPLWSCLIAHFAHASPS